MMSSPAAATSPRPPRPTRRRWQMLGWLEDGVLLLLVVLAFPLAIAIIGAPLAIVLRLLIEIGRKYVDAARVERAQFLFALYHMQGRAVLAAGFGEQ